MVTRLTEGLSGSLLDYGSGWGDICHALAGRFTEVAGVDVDPERVTAARREYPELAFGVCRPDGLDFEDRRFDVVLSIVVLPFVPSPEGYLRECARVLREGGTLVLAIPNRDGFWRTVASVSGGSWSWRSARLGTDDLHAMLAAAGFSVEREDHFYDPAFDRVRNLGEFVLSTLNAVGHLLRMGNRATYLGFRCRRLAAPA